MAVDLQGVQRVLVTRLRYLGDVVLSTPLLAALREALPQARIEYLTMEPYAEVLRHHPVVDEIHALPMNAGMGETLKVVARLSRPRVDWWIDLFSNPRSALLCGLARPRVSVGGDRGLRSRVFRYRRGAPEETSSAIEVHLDKLQPLLGALPPRGVQLRVTAEEIERVKESFGLGPDDSPVLLLPSATWPSKAWPAEKWEELVRRIQREGWGEVWILSAPDQEELSQTIATRAGCRIIPPLGLRELMALLSVAGAFVGNDGGILHCAVGVGAPTVGLFGPTEKEIWFPHDRFANALLAQESVACRPCHLHECGHLSCLRALPVSRVIDLLERVMATKGNDGWKR